MNKFIILKFANFISFFWICIPKKVRHLFFTSLLIIESRGKKADKGLKRLFEIKDKCKVDGALIGGASLLEKEITNILKRDF